MLGAQILLIAIGGSRDDLEYMMVGRPTIVDKR